MSAEARSSGRSVMTAADYIGEKPKLLEANRRVFYQEKPPSRQFIKWTKMNEEKQRLVKPPLEGIRRKKGRISESR
jgi:hypothetical protein